jgi:rare lipoprotein A
MFPLLICCLSLALLTACSSAPPAPEKKTDAPPVSTGGKFYQQDGPGERRADEFIAAPDAVPRAEPLHRFANRPYTVLGKDYQPMSAIRPFQQVGIASWYGKQFHGQKTSSGEVYDMYAMTAAHPTLPLPSYVKVTNTLNGRSVVVRVNDRGPFLHDRVIDLSFAGAAKIGYAQAGSAPVKVELIVFDSPAPVVVAPQPSAPADTPSTGAWFIQLAAFGQVDNATRFINNLAQLPASSAELRQASVVESAGVYRVRLGPFANREAAQAANAQVSTTLGKPGSLTR